MELLFLILLFCGAFQGIYLLIVLVGKNATHNRANRILTYLTGGITIGLCLRGLSLHQFPTLFVPQLVFLADMGIFLLGPLLYFYFRALLILEEKWKPTNWLHFIPFLANTLFFAPFLWKSTDEIYQIFEMSEGYFLLKIWAIIELIAILFNFSYWFLAYQTLNQYEQSYLEKYKLNAPIRFLKTLLLGSLPILLFWALTYTSRFVLDHILFAEWGYYVAWLAMSFWVYALAFSVLKHPEITELPQQKFKRNRYPNIPDLSVFKSKLEALMLEEKVFTNPELSLPLLAQQMQVSPHELSRYLSEFQKQNFAEFINTHRVEEFIRLAETKPQHTLLALAFDAGFNSKTHFNRIFKKMKQQTPSEFLKALKI